MTDTGNPSKSGGKVNKGLGLVAAFRAARISQRPALQSELRNSRAALRQERLDRLGKRAPQAPCAAATHTETVPEDATARPEPAPAPATGSSMFATFLNREDDTPPPVSVASSAPPQDMPAPAQVEPVPEVNAAPVCEATTPPEPTESPSPEAKPEAPPEPRVPLSTIGFGPGMMIRMSHLGIETVQELAAADPAWLRSALGDISRLINVELWIASARNACSQAA